MLGIGFVVIATGCFVVLDSSVKILSTSISVLIAVWFRYMCQAVGMTLVVLPMRGMRIPRTQRPWMHVLRGLLMVASTAMAFIGLKFMPVAEVTAIYALAPLTVTLLAVLFLGEHVNGLRWLLVVGGFSGAMLVIRPDNMGLGWEVLLPMAGMVLYSFFQILTSRLARTEDPLFLHMTSGWVGTLVMTAVLPWIWDHTPACSAWRLLLLAGLMGTVGHFLLILAYSKARATTLAPYMYMQIVFAMLSGWLVFGHLPGNLEIIGIAMISACGASSAMIAGAAAQRQFRAAGD